MKFFEKEDISWSFGIDVCAPFLVTEKLAAVWALTIADFNGNLFNTQYARQPLNTSPAAVVSIAYIAGMLNSKTPFELNHMLPLSPRVTIQFSIPELMSFLEASIALNYC